MKVILLQELKGKGGEGDVVDVAPGFANNYLMPQGIAILATKGTKVAIEGKLRYSSWERDGQRRSKLEVIVDELEFMSSRNGNNANQGYDNGMTAGYAPQPAPMAAPVAAPIVDASASVYDEDIPF